MNDEYRNFEEQAQEKTMDHVDDPGNEPKKESKIKKKKFWKKAVPHVKLAGLATLYGAAATGVAIGVAKLTGHEIVTVPAGIADRIKELVKENSEAIGEAAEKVVDTAKDAVETIDA